MIRFQSKHCTLKLVKIHRSANWNPSQTREQMEISKELRTVSATESVPVVAPAELQFDKPQPQDQMLFQENRLQLGQFVVRRAVLDEEYRVR